MEAREPILMCVTGAKGVGKTYTTLMLMKQYIRPNSQTGKKGRKILIFDVNKEYTEFKSLRPQDIEKYANQSKVEIRRILPLDENGNELGIEGLVAMLKHIVETFRGGMLVLEDINRYVLQANHVKEVISIIATNRHRDLDIVVHYQSLSALDPRMWQNTAVLRFHFQTDHVDRYKKKIPNYEMVAISQCIVNYRYHTKGDKRFYLTVSLLDNYIAGDFNLEDFVEGCRRYLMENSSIVNKLKGFYGNDKELARNAKIKELISMYYRGNMNVA